MALFFLWHCRLKHLDLKFFHDIVDLLMWLQFFVQGKSLSLMHSFLLCLECNIFGSAPSHFSSGWSRSLCKVTWCSLGWRPEASTQENHCCVSPHVHCTPHQCACGSAVCLYFGTVNLCLVFTLTKSFVRSVLKRGKGVMCVCVHLHKHAFMHACTYIHRLAHSHNSI